jgi:hypothetical protein
MNGGGRKGGGCLGVFLEDAVENRRGRDGSLAGHIVVKT